jgi:alpha-beta hydrolase superfamily lysophospholipase
MNSGFSFREQNARAETAVSEAASEAGTRLFLLSHSSGGVESDECILIIRTAF